MAESVWVVHGAAVSLPEVVSGGLLQHVDGAAWTDAVGLRQGHGTTYEGAAGQDAWFHYSVPVPPLWQGIPFTATAAEVVADTTPGAAIDAVHVHAADGTIVESRAGSRPGEVVLEQPYRVTGPVDISVHVTFSDRARVTLRGASVKCTSRRPTDPPGPDESVPVALSTHLGTQAAPANVRFELDHPELRDPVDAPFHIGVTFSADRRRLTIDDFPEVTASAMGAEVGIRKTGGGQGTFNPQTGEIALPLSLLFILPGGFLGGATNMNDNPVSLRLTTDTQSSGLGQAPT